MKQFVEPGPGPSFFCTVFPKQHKTSENRVKVAAFDSCLAAMSDS